MPPHRLRRGAWHLDPRRSQRDPRDFYHGLLALHVAAQQVKGLPERPGAEELEELAEPWRPWRTVAAHILWHHYVSVG